MTGKAVQVALDYYAAWTAKDMSAAMKYIAEDIVCEAPAGRISGAAAYRAFMEPFAGMLLTTTLIAAYGDDSQALIMYDTATPKVASGPAAECLTVLDFQIVHSRFIFDRLPFAT